MNSRMAPALGGKPARSAVRPPRLRLPKSFLMLCLAILAVSCLGAVQFGEVLIEPLGVVEGITTHGYREYRVMVENRSARDEHSVTLTYPEISYRSGNGLSRMSRTVLLPPGTRAAVPLWQPPLPLRGNDAFAVHVDGVLEGAAAFPGSHRHMESTAWSPVRQPVSTSLLVSRSLDFGDATRWLAEERAPWSAAMATKSPDAAQIHGAASPNTWMPNNSAAGPHWVELVFSKPVQADQLVIYHRMNTPLQGEAMLTGVSGSNLVQLQLSLFSSQHGGRPSAEQSFPVTAEGVSTVRLTFGSTSPGSIAIDAVALKGPSTKRVVWASDARSSSEADPASLHRHGATGESASRRLLRSELPVSDWSDYWLSYTPFDAIVLAGSDFAAMPPAVAACLWRYAESGGTLIVFGGAPVPEPWSAFDVEPIDGGRCHTVGFGACYVFEARSAAALTPEARDAATASAENNAVYWKTLPNDADMNLIFPVIGKWNVPVRGTVFIMLVFVLLIGPVNIGVLNRLNRRIWLLWTVPAISLLTCVMVYAYMLLREGVTPTVRIEGLTLMDQANRRASSFGVAAFYCPLTPAQGLMFDLDTAVTPLLERAEHFGHRGASRGTRHELDWSQGQHLTRGWILARIPAHFHMCKSETRRERLAIDRSGEQLAVMNGLGARIRSVWLADFSGQLYTGSGIGAGQKAALKASADTLHTPSSTPRVLLQKFGATPAGGSVAAAAMEYLRPGTYLAELEDNPFLPNALGTAGKTRVRSRAMVYGILEPDRPE